MRRLLLDHAVAGLHHHVDRSTVDDMREGHELTLTREPSNPYDRNAVRIDWRGVKIGYVPAAFSSIISALLDASDIHDFSIVADVGDTISSRKALVHFRLWIAPDPS